MTPKEALYAQMVKEQGGTVLDVTHRGKHPMLLCDFGDGPIKLFIACTPGDHRALLNFKSDLRRYKTLKPRGRDASSKA